MSLGKVTVRAPGPGRPVLDEVSIDVRRGERVVVLGPSGSGKSTLLHVISGVIPFAQNLVLDGGVRLDGVDATGLSVIERSRTVGMLSQDPAAAVCLARVDQEVALPLENHGVPSAEIAARVALALHTADAAGLRERGTGELSGGEIQRVALAATLAARPAVILLDEPTSMLDPAGVRAVRHAISAVADHRDSAVILVEHRLDEYTGADGGGALPERAIVLGQGGGVVADGPTGQVPRDNAARLHRAGCWLPLDFELLAVMGHERGLQSEHVREWLRHIPARGRGPTGREPAGPLLRADSFVVGHHLAGARRTRWGRPRLHDRVQPVLRDVSLTLHAGDIVALLGANGSGKSSLLLTLAGLVPPGAGRITGARPSMVFQNPEYQFLAHRVWDEIAVGLGGDPAEVAAIVEHRLRLHRLEHVADHNPHRLSGGEKRRLSLGAMLAHADRLVLLADEPTFGLDRRDTVAAARVFQDEASGGRAVMFSSHDLRFVATIADRVIVLADGRVVADGPTAAVLRDATALGRAGLDLPRLVAWLLSELDDDGAVRALRRLFASQASAGVPAVPRAEASE